MRLKTHLVHLFVLKIKRLKCLKTYLSQKYKNKIKKQNLNLYSLKQTNCWQWQLPAFVLLSALIPALYCVSVCVCVVLTPRWWRQRCLRTGRSGWAPAGWRSGTGGVGRGWRHTERRGRTAAPSGRERELRLAGPPPALSHLETHTQTLTWNKKNTCLLSLQHKTWKWEIPLQLQLCLLLLFNK